MGNRAKSSFRKYGECDFFGPIADSYAKHAIVMERNPTMNTSEMNVIFVKYQK
jgi:hypothetical protein